MHIALHTFNILAVIGLVYVTFFTKFYKPNWWYFLAGIACTLNIMGVLLHLIKYLIE